MLCALKGFTMSDNQIVIPEPTRTQNNSRSIAPAWHTAGVLLLLCAFVALSAHLHSLSQTRHRVIGYFAVMAPQWLITAFVWFGCRLHGVELRTLAGGMASGWRPILRDLGLAVAFLIFGNSVVAVLVHLIQPV